MQALVVGESTAQGPAAVRDALARRGHSVTSTASGAAALAVHRVMPVEIVVVDWHSTTPDPSKFCRQLREESRDAEVALLAIVESGTTQLDDALAVGISDYVTLPVSPAGIETRVAIVERWLERLRALRNQVARGVHAQARLAQNEADFHALMDACPEPICIHRSRTLIYANPALARSLGYPHAKAMVGVALGRLVHPEELAFVEQRLCSVEQTGHPAPVREGRLVRLDGSVCVAEAHAFTIQLADGPALVTVAKDLTQSRTLEEQLHHTERLGTIGAIAASVAHELNNPLTLVLCNLSDVHNALPALASYLPNGSATQLEQRIHAMEDAVEHVRVLARDLTDFARSKTPAPQLVDLAQVLERTARMVGGHLRNRVGASLELDLEPVGAVRASDTRLVQVFLNLMLNAGDALSEVPRGGERSIAIRLRTEGNEAWVDVSDSGPGIAPELRDRVFEPFFSTKSRERGTGLGLSVAKSIVTELGGTLEVVKSGPGATLRVRLPLAS